jgi:ABC-type uncharacterized transport system permease subunit
MAIIEVNRNPGKGELNWFGLIFLAFFVLISGLIWFKFDRPGPARWLLTAAAAVTLLYYAIPPLRRLLYLAWMYAAFPIGWVMSHLVLAIVFYLVFTPIGLIMRLFGKDPMQRKFRKDGGGYWQEHDPHREPGRYFRQF